MGTIIKPTLILSLVAFIASFALSHVDKSTKPAILLQAKQKQEKALSIVLPGYTVDAQDKRTWDIDGMKLSYWIGEKKAEGTNKMTRGYAFITEKPGYSGTVKSMVGIDSQGMILGLSVLQQTETPGLGARATEVASKMTFIQALFGDSSGESEVEILPWFQEQFTGLDTKKKIQLEKKGDWNVAIKDELLEVNAISAITGATITTKAVRDSIGIGIAALQKCIEMDEKEGK